MLKFMKLLVLSVVMAVFCAGAAWAFDYNAPYAQINHTSHAEIVDGKTDYKPTGTETHRPEFRISSILVLNAPQSTSGTLNLHASEKIWVGYWRSETGEYISEEEFTGDKTFSLWKRTTNDNYFAGNADGVEAEFGKAGDDIVGFSSQPFSFVVGSATLDSNFPAIRTTEKQLEDNCVPYLELITDNKAEKLVAIKWKFVDPTNPSIALLKDTKGRSINREATLTLK